VSFIWWDNCPRAAAPRLSDSSRLCSALTSNKKAKTGECRCTVCNENWATTVTGMCSRHISCPSVESHALALREYSQVPNLKYAFPWLASPTRAELNLAALTEVIDIYCEWIDECEKANKEAVQAPPQVKPFPEHASNECIPWPSIPASVGASCRCECLRLRCARDFL
jgi:transcription elongation factor Elf1